MAGNIIEWVSSLYKPYPYITTDGREDLNARGNRVLRGGIFYYNGIGGIYSAHRDSLNPAYSDSYIGFRCAKDEDP